MGLTLLSATPSPYAREVNIALHERNISCALKNEVPWNSTTKIPKWDPLEQLPVLILDNGDAVYDSSHIFEYISLKYKDSVGGDLLLRDTLDDLLEVKQIDVLATGMMDAMGLKFFEQAREDEASAEWTARQERKIQGGLDALEKLAKTADYTDFLVGGKLTIADLSVGSFLGMYEIVELPWKEGRPELAKYHIKLEERDSFQRTKPYMFELKDKID